MFTPKTKRIEKLAELYPEIISDLECIFDKPTNIYIDWQNVIHWQKKLRWNFDLKRIKRFFDSFDNIKTVKIYTGTLEGNDKSEQNIPDLESWGYVVITKPVKKMKLSVDTSSVSDNSPTLLQQFIKKSLLDTLDISTIISLNKKLSELNEKNILFLTEEKCNFDVEMGRDLLKDFEFNGIENFILWTTDSDFEDPIKQIRDDGKKAIIFAFSGKVAPELDGTGVYVFDIKKIKEFVCWSKHLPKDIKDRVDEV